MELPYIFPERRINKSNDFRNSEKYDLSGSESNISVKSKSPSDREEVKLPPLAQKDVLKPNVSASNCLNHVTLPKIHSCSSTESLNMLPQEKSSYQPISSKTNKKFSTKVDSDKKQTIAHQTNFPKFISTEEDINNFSVKNMIQLEPGTVRLSIYYHEPTKRKTLVGAANGYVNTPNLKGFVFDKESLCYYPYDRRFRKRLPFHKSMGSLVDMVLFTVKINNRSRKVRTTSK